MGQILVADSLPGAFVYSRDAAVLGDRLPAKGLSSAQAPLFAMPALRELESACRVSILWDAVTVPHSTFHGVLRGSPGGSAGSLRPKPSVSICARAFGPK